MHHWRAPHRDPLDNPRLYGWGLLKACLKGFIAAAAHGLEPASNGLAYSRISLPRVEISTKPVCPLPTKTPRESLPTAVSSETQAALRRQ